MLELASILIDVSTPRVIWSPDEILGIVGWFVFASVGGLLDFVVGISTVLDAHVPVLNGEVLVPVEVYCAELSETDSDTETSAIPVA
jgi:hypothetical protein